MLCKLFTVSPNQVMIGIIFLFRTHFHGKRRYDNIKLCPVSFLHCKCSPEKINVYHFIHAIFFRLILWDQSQFVMRFWNLPWNFESQPGRYFREFICTKFSPFLLWICRCTVEHFCYCQNINWLLKFNQWLAKKLTTHRAKWLLYLQITCLTTVTSGHKWTKLPKNWSFSNTMRLASHGIRLGDGLKYHEIFLPAGRYHMYVIFIIYMLCEMCWMLSTPDIRSWSHWFGPCWRQDLFFTFFVHNSMSVIYMYVYFSKTYGDFHLRFSYIAQKYPLAIEGWSDKTNVV